MNDLGFYYSHRRNQFQLKIVFIASLLILLAQLVFADQPEMHAKLENSLQELDQVRKSISKEKLPMVKGLNALEDEVMDVRLEH